MLAQIVNLQFEIIKKRLSLRNIKISLTVSAKKYLSEKGFDPIYGARPLKRVIQNDIMDELALEIIEGKIRNGSNVKVDTEKNESKIVLRYI